MSFVATTIATTAEATTVATTEEPTTVATTEEAATVATTETDITTMDTITEGIGTFYYFIHNCLLTIDGTILYINEYHYLINQGLILI